MNTLIKKGLLVLLTLTVASAQAVRSVRLPDGRVITQAVEAVVETPAITEVVAPVAETVTLVAVATTSRFADFYGQAQDAFRSGMTSGQAIAQAHPYAIGGSVALIGAGAAAYAAYCKREALKNAGVKAYETAKNAATFVSNNRSLVGVGAGALALTYAEALKNAGTKACEAVVSSTYGTMLTDKLPTVSLDSVKANMPELTSQNAAIVAGGVTAGALTVYGAKKAYDRYAKAPVKTEVPTVTATTVVAQPVVAPVVAPVVPTTAPAKAEPKSSMVTRITNFDVFGTKAKAQAEELAKQAAEAKVKAEQAAIIRTANVTEFKTLCNKAVTDKSVKAVEIQTAATKAGFANNENVVALCGAITTRSAKVSKPGDRSWNHVNASVVKFNNAVQAL